MSRRHTAFAAALLLAAAPALAETPLPCRLGPDAHTHLLAGPVEMVVLAGPGRSGRTEYRMLVRNPHPWPAAVLAATSLPGLVSAPAEPVALPPHRAAPVLIGWFPHDMSRGRMAPPSVEAVQAAMTIPFCQVRAPGQVSGGAAFSAGGAILARGLQVIRDEGAQDIRQRL
ncbi:hypothetical protein [Falsiroseomonas sp.]|uniref:hypothetical protein n=1 Tax=Falsiroseomonas sp. TaxID=2870721 RepID=UPI0027280719|nr:hypothetical protein [Falsiroseomonas sp.]MDO9502095.1 hypothetical protein [Falsiroseomonas sp.]MDP3415266.1 hypothetical protein [Falsiroseomonas sp.]